METHKHQPNNNCNINISMQKKSLHAQINNNSHICKNKLSLKEAEVKMSIGTAFHQ